MMAFQVRPMQRADLPRAREILNGIIRLGGTTAFETELGADEFAGYYLHGDDLIACHVVLDPDGQVAGFQWIGRNPDLPLDCADIATFTRRDPPLRGAGRALFATTCAHAREAGYGWINATIRADNVPGLGYYAKMGFVDHSVARGVALRGGTRVDRMSRRFNLGARKLGKIS